MLTSAREMAKTENPFNKRRRILLNCKESWRRRASYAALNASSLCSLSEEKSEEGDEEEYEEEEESERRTVSKKFVGAFRSPRSFSLCDLQRAELA